MDKERRTVLLFTALHLHGMVLADLGTWGLARQSGLEGFPHRAIAEGGDLGNN